jgi:hypothetical protein
VNDVTSLSDTRVLGRFVEDGRIVQMPARRSRRLVVLDWVVQRFEVGQRYTELDVNARLRPAFEDVAALRRYLVDERFLDREDGWYWRCGGTVGDHPAR